MIVADEIKTERGNYKIFLGMAAGVGKTYRMLQEGRAEAEAGRDVVIGYLEPHDRAETAAQADGLEVVPRRRVPYRDDTLVEEMDLPAVLRRAPELCLIDELAHTNPPGLEHEKRYEDIEDVLAAGIDVFSTVNVQHLESLNDQVAELTGVRVRETFPDSVLSSADEVVLIDLTPQALIQRLREGKVYPDERVERGAEQLLQDREPGGAARGGAAPGGRGRRGEAARARGDRWARGRPRGRRAAPQAVGERLLALVKPRPSSQRLVRRAWRSAQRLGAELDLLWVKQPGTTPSGEQQQPARRAAQAGRGARRTPADRGGTTTWPRPQRAWRPGAGTTYVLIGVAAVGEGAAALRGVAARAPARGDAGRGHPHRRRPHEAPRRRPMIWLLVIPAVLVVVALTVLVLRMTGMAARPPRITSGAARGSCSRSSATTSRSPR